MSEAEHSHKLNSIIGKVLQIPVADISDGLSPLTTSAWDSFNSLMLISEIESAFSVRFTIEECRAMQKVGDFKTTLRAHGVEI